MDDKLIIKFMQPYMVIRWLLSNNKMQIFGMFFSGMSTNLPLRLRATVKQKFYILHN